jgi:(p)ppGpp synthase/HD superfamily hydrolase
LVDIIKERILKKSSYLPESHMELLKRAISFAEEAHQGQKRATGELVLCQENGHIKQREIAELRQLLFSD